MLWKSRFEPVQQISQKKSVKKEIRQFISNICFLSQFKSNLFPKFRVEPAQLVFFSKSLVEPAQPIFFQKKKVEPAQLDFFPGRVELA